MRELQTTFLDRDAQLEHSIFEKLLARVSDSAPIQVVKDARIGRVQEQLLSQWDTVSPKRKRGVFLFLAMLIGLAIGASLRFRKQLSRDQSDASVTKKRGQFFFLAIVIGTGVSAILWFRKHRRVEPVSLVRRPDVSIFVVYPHPPSPVIVQSERVVQPPAAMPLLRSTVMPRDEPSTPPVAEASTSSAPQRPVTQQPSAKRTSVSLAAKRGILLLLLLLVILAVGAGLWFGPLSHSATRVAGIAPSPIVTRAVPTAAPIRTETYKGTIYDLAGNIHTSLSLTKFSQQQGKLSGYLTVGPQFQGSGALSGTIDSAGHFQFTVLDTAGNATLFFSGAMQSGNSLVGNYYACRPSQGNQCVQNPAEYGLWNVVLMP